MANRDRSLVKIVMPGNAKKLTLKEKKGFFGMGAVAHDAPMILKWNVDFPLKDILDQVKKVPKAFTIE